MNDFVFPLHLVNYTTAGKEELPLPYLVYLQGGPGFECSRPTEASGWISKACEEYRVILMDQACPIHHSLLSIKIETFLHLIIIMCLHCSEEQAYQHP